VAEVSVQLNNSIEVIEVESTSVGENKYGTLHPYIPRPDMCEVKNKRLLQKTKNFNGDVPVKYYWKWFSDNASLTDDILYLKRYDILEGGVDWLF
jgi:hypothetical protein